MYARVAPSWSVAQVVVRLTGRLRPRCQMGMMAPPAPFMSSRLWGGTFFGAQRRRGLTTSRPTIGESKPWISPRAGRTVDKELGPGDAPATREHSRRGISRQLSGDRTHLSGYDEIRPLGQGTYGRVMLVREQTTGRYLAMKVQRVASVLNDMEAIEARAQLARVQSVVLALPEGSLVRKHFLSTVRPLEDKLNDMAPQKHEYRSFAGDMVHRTLVEKELGESISHPFVVRFHDGFIENGECFLFFDYAGGGTLKQHIAQVGGNMEPGVVRDFVAELVLAIEHIQEHGVAHRDLKPENIMISSDGHCLLADFGLATKVAQSNLGEAASGKCGKKGSKTVCGTAEYIPPEVLSQDSYDPIFVDRWALGCILYELLAGGVTPFGDTSAKAVFLNILMSSPSFPPGFPCDAMDLIKALLRPEPTARPGMSEVRCHPYFAGIDWDVIIAHRKGVVGPITKVTGSDAEETHLDAGIRGSADGNLILLDVVKEAK